MDDQFDFVAVCLSPDGAFDVEQLSATPDEGLEWEVRFNLPNEACRSDPSIDLSEFVVVTGTMKQPGLVTMWTSSSSLAAPWSFQLSMPRGRHDLVASSAFGDTWRTGRMLWDRNVDVFANGNLGSLDLVAAGEPIEVESIVTFGAVGDVDTFTGVRTGDGQAIIAEIPASIIAHAPQGMLRQGDEETGYVRSVGPVAAYEEGERQVSQRAVGTIKALLSGVELLPPPPYIVDGERVAWDDFPGGVTLTLRTACMPVCTPQTPQSTQSAMATEGWLRKTDRHALEFYTDVPGYSGQWHVSTAAPHHRSLTISKTDALSGILYQTTTDDTYP